MHAPRRLREPTRSTVRPGYVMYVMSITRRPQEPRRSTVRPRHETWRHRVPEQGPVRPVAYDVIHMIRSMYDGVTTYACMYTHAIPDTAYLQSAPLNNMHYPSIHGYREQDHPCNFR
mgnify:CR=1 FL=1